MEAFFFKWKLLNLETCEALNIHPAAVFRSIDLTFGGTSQKSSKKAHSDLMP